MVRTTIYLPESLKERIEAYAARHASTEAAVIRQAVERLLADERDNSWLPDLAGIARSTERGSVADRVDEVLAETGFGTRRR
ncbi:MAG TPA: CopG family transcriptional regulator [Micromonosporaceae bacterium]|nr:CopG family transcriptional regulator [Micromonosporaceae bacterium]